MKTKSCIYLQKAIYLAPNEIRACCQRFFLNGKMKGDVPLVTLNEARNVSFQEVINAKKMLIDSINNGTDQLCLGCPQLATDEWNDVESEKINVLSIEDHSLCNMKCTYCSDTYYGGIKPQYDLEYLLKDMTGVDSDLHIAWGGGEPTVRKDFESLFNSLTERFTPRTQRVFTNALKYSNALQKAVDGRLASITASVDAGTENTFRKVRGANGLDRVLKNLKSYSQKNPDLVTIKYIFTDENLGFDEIHQFVDNIQKHDLMKCNFLISTDFKSETISDDKIINIITMYFMLYEKGIFATNFDDHIYLRLRSIGSFISEIIDTGSLKGEFTQVIHDFGKVISRHEKNDIVVWGTGEFSRYLLRTSRKMKDKEIRVINVIDGNREKHGTDFMGMTVESPEILHQSNASVVIASSNYYGEIVNRILMMGISPDRIAPNFIL
jgi:poly(ribitol-phosphate) beta-N-acetylglucosaminyltransferase